MVKTITQMLVGHLRCCWVSIGPLLSLLLGPHVVDGGEEWWWTGVLPLVEKSSGGLMCCCWWRKLVVAYCVVTCGEEWWWFDVLLACCWRRKLVVHYCVVASREEWWCPGGWDRELGDEEERSGGVTFRLKMKWGRVGVLQIWSLDHFFFFKNLKRHNLG